ncbi:MAG: asparagine synthetase B, partial [Firmicutes bacterium]|nr:asparagine synthetase B [Bacillota bacterium]
MCGFIGFTGYLENRKEIINKMMDRIVHRGPDMASDFLGDGVTLGFRRLSIIDLSEAGNQPMSSADGRYSIVFNGEIYNYAELKKELCEKGYVFRTEGDTEVLLYMLAEYGENALLKLRGMFAFAFWDADEKSILCARDFFGIKPFYYTRLKSGELLFGSEIKSFLEHPEFEKNVNEKALLPYLTFQYSSCDETFFKGVFKLPPAHLL